MEKVINNLPLGLLCAHIVRVLVVGPQIPDAIVICSLSGLIYALSQVKYNKQSIQVQQDIADLRAEVQQYREKSSEAVSYVSAVKMSQAMRGK